MNEDRAHLRETAIRRLFAEGLKCSSDSSQQFRASILGMWGDPAGIAKASFFECISEDKVDCLALKYVVGYTLLTAKNILEHCAKDIEKLLGESLNYLLKHLDNTFHRLESCRCSEDCEKILKILDEIIEKYIFPEEFYKDESKSILGCCNNTAET